MNKITKGIIALALGVIVAIPIMGSLNKNDEIKEETKITESVKEEEEKVEESMDEGANETIEKEKKLSDEERLAAARALVERYKNGEITQAEFQEELGKLGVSTQSQKK